MKRQRGRTRRPGQGNRSFESNGPNVKIRGTAGQIHEKYIQYARDAHSSGDRVRSENFLQHAEHYYRVMTLNGQRLGVDSSAATDADGTQAIGSDQQPSQTPMPDNRERMNRSRNTRRHSNTSGTPDEASHQTGSSDTVPSPGDSALDMLAREQATISDT